jgi:GNAT superfamily N-acetyltransferase
MLDIIRVRTETDAAEVRLMVGEFFDWMRDLYPEGAESITAYWNKQDIPTQLRDLLKIFAPPKAECLLARLNGEAVGIVMTKPHSGDMCEMNRMFVRPAARGHGVGRALVGALLDAARDLGYKRMMLAGGTRHTEALALYRSLGFVHDPSLPDTGSGDVEVRMIRDL